MPSINTRTKGKQGEYDFIKRFEPFFPGRHLKRNLEQVRAGGSDIENTHPFVVEVKFVTDDCMSNKNKWWKQVLTAVLDPVNDIPVVAYKGNRRAWRFLMSVNLIGVPGNGWLELSEEDWLQFVIKTLETN
jgi:hypothetical protein